jgi:hypothetical protein
MTAYVFKPEDLARVKRECAARKRKARTANFGSAPKFYPGMTTETYVQLFAIGRDTLPIKITPQLRRPAPYLTPSQDEVLVEVDADEVTYA